MKITNAYLNHNRPRTKRKQTTAIAIHWVGNPGSSAMANRNYFNTTSREVSSNYIIGLFGEVICCIPDEEVSWCTNQANRYSVSIENCHPDQSGKFTTATYHSLVELTAQLCRKYHLNPLSGGVIRHFDVTKKVCPKWFVSIKNGGTDTANHAHWNQFLQDVSAKMNPTESTDAATKAEVPYRVKVTVSALNIRSGVGTETNIVGCIRDRGVYTIVAVKNGWGKLKSGAGWICLAYTRTL